MAGRVNSQLRLIARPRGPVKDSDFRLTEEPVPALKEGEILVKTLYFSLDPAQRNWMDDDPDSYIPPVKLGDVMGAVCLGKVIETRNPAFRRGDITWSIGGWQQYQIIDPTCAEGQLSGLTVLQTDPALPLSNYLSGCGITGLTALFGILNVGRPKPGETVLVSAAAGAVGSVAAQIAKKISGCRVIGIAGTEEKCRWLTDELGIDAAINYRQEKDMAAAIRTACPAGVDIFFDNVGGEILDATLMNINFQGRILMCGRIATYLDDYKNRPGPYNMWQLLVKNARIEGFTAHTYADQYPSATRMLETWTKSGILQFREDIVEGLGNTLSAFRTLFTGENKGRLMMKLADANDPD
ncbi:MAG: NADP-dependent oxidoreductase [Desulfuromonadales bacterium]|nr:NADP-dependent oxidoreductase [Desulfuromonadales bacterium]